MGVGWIEHIWNNTDQPWYMKSTDSANNGTLQRVDAEGNILEKKYDMQDGGYHELNPQSQYKTTFCGVPWFWADQHFKTISPTLTGSGIHFYQSEVDGKNYIRYEDPNTGKPLGQQTVADGLLTDYHCHLRLENDGFYFDVVNDNGQVYATIAYIVDETAKYAAAAASVLGTVLKGAATKNG